MKPGLWHSALSRLGLLLRSCLDEGCSAAEPTILGRPAPPVPPVFEHCTRVRLFWKPQCLRYIGRGA